MTTHALTRIGRKIEDLYDLALHLVLNRRARRVARLEVRKKIRRRFEDLRRGWRAWWG